ncbi:MAG: FG-GAP-like repeat-containing protein [Actinomycetota bacterium]
MRRLPIVGLAISLLLVPVAASASVPDAAVTRDLVGASGPAAVASAIGDVTGDGVADLIVARGADAGPDAYTVAVFDGPLTDPLPADPSFVVTPTARSDAYQVAVGDLNHDGFGDLAVADVNGVDALDNSTPGIDVFLEPAGGGDIPAAASDFMSPIPVIDLVVADMNDDGRDDLLFTRPNTNPIDVRLRTQLFAGGFATASAPVSNAPTSGLTVGDMNGDGRNDFALDGTLSGSIPVFEQNADHSFTQADVTLPVGITSVTNVVLTDLNGDGSDDVLVITGADELAWALADGAGGFGAFSAAMPAPQVAANEVADLNGDGRQDLATFGVDGSLRIYLQQDGGGLAQPCVFPGTASPGGDAATSTGDLTADGAADIADADVGGTSGGAWLFRQLTGGAQLATSVDASVSAGTVPYNGAVDITGTFRNPGGGCLRDDTVSLQRTGPDGTLDLGPTQVAGDGSFSFEDVPPTAGSFDYQVVFAGDDTHATSTSATMHVDVAKGPTSLTLAVSDDTIMYGTATTLRAMMHGGVPTSVVRFDRFTANGWKAVGTATVGGDHVATLDVRPSALSRYRAVFEPTTNRKGSVSGSVTVQVHAVLESRMIGKGTTNGRNTVYACCTAYFYVKLKPPHPGSRWVATVQYHGKTRWRPLGRATYRFERDGDAAIYLDAVKGYHYRVRGHWAGDADHLGATSAWQYFSYR